MSKKITVAEVDQAKAAFMEAKKVAKKRGAKADHLADYKAQAESFARLRSAWRTQEEKAGRRTGIVSTTDGEAG